MSYGLSYAQCLEFMGGHEPDYDAFHLIPTFQDDDECVKALNAVSEKDIQRITQAIGYYSFFHQQLREDEEDHPILIAGYLPDEFCDPLDIGWGHLHCAALYLPDAPEWVRLATGSSPADLDEEEDDEEAAA